MVLDQTEAATPDIAKPRSRRPAITAAALAVAACVGAGATAIAQRDHRLVMVALTPQSVSALKDGTMAAVKGDVAEIFGNKFVVQDASGRVLVETGRRGENAALVLKDEPVTVQGRFDHGFLHAAAITHADGRVDALDPPPPPRTAPPAADGLERHPLPPA